MLVKCWIIGVILRVRNMMRADDESSEESEESEKSEDSENSSSEDDTDPGGWREVPGLKVKQCRK